MGDELEKRRDFFESVKKEFSLKVWRVCCELSFFDQLRFCKLVNRTAERLQNQAMAKNSKTLRWLIKHQLGEGVLRHSTIVKEKRKKEKKRKKKEKKMCFDA